MAKAIHTDDSVTTCDCCGRSGLKFTVLMELDDGTTANYGSTCAARNTGKTAPQIKKEIETRAAEVLAAARKEFSQTQEALQEAARFQMRPRTLVGRAAADFVREARNAADVKRREIAAKYGVEIFKL